MTGAHPWIETENTGDNSPNHRYEQADLSQLLGSASRASEILNRKRALSMDMAYKLHREWKIPIEALLKPSRID